MPTGQKQEFAVRLKQERNARHLTQFELAEQIEADERTVRLWESGKQRPGLWFQRRLCQLFGLDGHELGLDTRKEWNGPSPTVEALPEEYVKRPDELQQLKGYLLAKQEQLCTAITSTSILKGAGGYGKTTLAQALCYAEEIQAAFEQIEWISLGESLKPGAVVEKIRSILHHIEHTSPPIENIEAAKAELRVALENRRILLVIDDAWYASDLRPFLTGGPNCVRLITTRNEGILPPEVACVTVGAMKPEEAVQVLSFRLGTPREIRRYERTFYELTTMLKEWPLLLSLANGIIRIRMKLNKQTLPNALASLRAALEHRGIVALDAKDPRERHEAVSLTLDISLDLLEPAEYARYLQLAIFPEDAFVPLKEIHRLWSGSGINEMETEEECVRLSELSLLRSYDLSEHQARLHDIIRGYLLVKVGNDLPHIQRNYLETYQVGRYADLPAQETYAWTHLLTTHLVQAKQPNMLFQTVTDLRYLAKKMFLHQSVYAAEAEIQLVSAEFSKQEDWASSVDSLEVLRLELARINNLLYACATLQEVETTILCYLYHHEELAPFCRALQQELRGLIFLPWRPLPSTASIFLIRTLRGHTGPVTDCAISLDDNWIVSASADTTLIMWNARTGEVRFTMEGHTAPVTSCAINAQTTRIVSTAEDGIITIWNASTGNQMLSFSGHEGSVTDCAISADGNWLITASADKTLKIWDIQNINTFPPLETYHATLVHTLVGHTTEVSRCVISHDDAWMLSASADEQTLKVWDKETGVLRRTIPLENIETVPYIDCAISHDGTFVVSAYGIALEVRDVASWEKRDIEAGGQRGLLRGCAISPDDTWMLSASMDTTLKGWRIDTGIDCFILADHADYVTACAISHSGKQIVSASEDYTLKIWQVPEITEERFAAEDEYMFGFFSCAVSASGEWAVAVSIADQVKLYDTQTGEETRTLGDWPTTSTRCTISPDDALVLSSAEHTRLVAWDAQTGEECFSATVPSGQILCCAISPNGECIVSGGDDQLLRIWDAHTGEELFVLGGHSGSVNGCAISPDGDWVVSASDDHTLKIWDIHTGAELRTLRGHTEKVNDCAVLLPDNVIISASNDGTVRIWQEQQVSTLQHEAPVTRCVVTPDRRLLVTLAEKQLKVWDLHTQACLNTFHARNTLFDCAFHPDGRHCLVAADDDLYFLKIERTSQQ